MNKMWSTVFLAAGVTSVLVTGCSSGTSNTVSSGTSNEKVVITYWDKHPQMKPLLDQTISDFQKAHPNIEVKVDYAINQAYTTQLQSAISGNNLPDIFDSTPQIPIAQLVSLGLVHNLDDVFTNDIKNKFSPDSWSEGQTMMNGKIYSFPLYTLHGYAFEMFYNKDVLQKAGLTEKDVPRSWDDLIKVSKEIMQKTNGQSYGVILGLQTNWEATDSIAQMATDISPDVTTNGFNFKTGKYELNSQGNIDSINFYKQLQQEKILEPDSLTNDRLKSLSAFQAGKAAFIFEGNFTGSNLEQAGFHNFGVAPIPTKDGGPQYFTSQGSTDKLIYVSQNTKHYSEVKLFLNYMFDHMYPLMIQQGIDYTPMPDINKNTKTSDAQFEQVEALQDKLFVQVPNPYQRNNNTIKVDTEMSKSMPKMTIGDITLGYLTGQVTDLKGTLDKLTNDTNQAFQDGLKKVQGTGAKVSESDYIFPNWTPFQPYTNDKYAQLK